MLKFWWIPLDSDPIPVESSGIQQNSSIPAGIWGASKSTASTLPQPLWHMSQELLWKGCSVSLQSSTLSNNRRVERRWFLVTGWKSKQVICPPQPGLAFKASKCSIRLLQSLFRRRKFYWGRWWYGFLPLFLSECCQPLSHVSRRCERPKPGLAPHRHQPTKWFVTSASPTLILILINPGACQASSSPWTECRCTWQLNRKSHLHQLMEE